MNERINKIFSHPSFEMYIKRIAYFENERMYCKHDLQHFLDVARIAYILNLELGMKIQKDIIYGAALLHDIGRFKQYESKIPHAKASADLCEDIFEECGYKEGEIETMKKAILYHNTETIINEGSNLASILYIADKKSRKCFDCKEAETCNWSNKKKNLEIDY